MPLSMMLVFIKIEANGMEQTLANKTLFITGGSRGIGRAIALRAAQDGARIVIAAKTSDPHPTLPGTIHTVAKEIEELGGSCLPIQCDIRNEEQIQQAVAQAVEMFGGIDILINNASAIQLTGTLETPMKRFDLMFDVNVRATYATSQACLPHLLKSENPHILTLSPPISLKPKWFKRHVAYTMSKYGMSMCTLGMSEEFKSQGVAVNSLWPMTTIATDAIRVNFPPEIYQSSRKPEIMSDAAYLILTKEAKQTTGQFFVDEIVLRENGVSDFSHYALDASKKLIPDFFLD